MRMKREGKRVDEIAQGTQKPPSEIRVIDFTLPMCHCEIKVPELFRRDANQRMFG